MIFRFDKTQSSLCDEEKACAVNLAFTLDVTGYDKVILGKISKTFTAKEKREIIKFWLNLNELTARAALCLMEFEGKI